MGPTGLRSGDAGSSNDPEKSNRGIVGRESPADAGTERQFGSSGCQEGDQPVVEIGDFAVGESVIELSGSGAWAV